MGYPNLPSEINERLRGPYTANRALSVADRQGLFNLKADRPISTRQNFDPFNVWHERNSGSLTRGDSHYLLATDGATTASEAVLESARLGVYRAGVENEMAAGVWIPQRPTGDGEVEIGYRLDGIPDGVSHVITSDDWAARIQNRNHATVEVTRSSGAWQRGNVTEYTDGGEVVGYSYGLDPLQGNNTSAIDWDPTKGYVYGITIGWYGPLSTLFWVDAIADNNGVWGQRRVPLLLYRPVKYPAFEVPNRPIHVRVDNGTTAEAVQAKVAGRQFSVQGSVDPTPEPTFQEAIGQSLPMDGTGIGPQDWYVVAVIRRKTGNEGVAVGLEELEVSAPNESLSLMSRVVDPQYLTGVSYEGPDENSANQTALEFDIQDDTTTRVSVDTWSDTADGGKTKVQGIGYRGDHEGTGAKNTAVSGNISGDLSFPIVRENPTVFFARTRSGTADTVDVIVKASEVGS